MLHARRYVLGQFVETGEAHYDVAPSRPATLDSNRDSILNAETASGACLMRIKWYGHAAFLIETQGLRIILDPFRSPDSGGYEPIDEPADIVVVSHENDRYHSHLGQIVQPFDVVRALEIPPGGQEVLGIRFEALRVYETPERKPEDEVTV